MKQNFEEIVKEYLDKHFEKEKKNYKIKIESDINEGFSFKKSFEDIKNSIKLKLQPFEYDTAYNYLNENFQNIESNYEINPFNNALNSKTFQKELVSKNKTLEDFIEIHKKYLVEDEMLKFHHQNKAIFERYFKIQYNDKLKYKVDYEDLKLCKGNPENDGITIDEWSRLEEILNPPKQKVVTHKLQKNGVELSTKDIAVFMILFRAYYKINFSSYVEFVELSRLIFDDLHYNITANDSKLGTSIKRYIKGEDLFAGNFDYNSSKTKILGILSNITLKDFKKYVEQTKIDKFKHLIK